MPWSTSGTLRAEPVVPSANSRSCRSDSSGPSAARAFWPAFLPPRSRVSVGLGMAVRSTWPVGSRRSTESTYDAQPITWATWRM